MTLYAKTAEIVDAIQKHDRVAVKSCNSSGKTFTVARVVLAFLMSYPGECEVITTAPTKRQVEDLLWKEISIAHQNSLIPIGGDLLRVELRLSREWFAKGFTARRGDMVSVQGYHAPHVLVVVDEASGVDPSMYTAINTIRSGGHVKQLLIGNPTASDGPFYDAFTRDRDRWHTITISAYDTPNVQARKILVPGLVTYDWVKEQYETEGPDSPLYQIHVLGQFPDQSDSNLIQVLWIGEARDDPPPEDPQAPFVAGFDAAWEGLDESVLCIRQGMRMARPLEAWRGLDTMKSVRRIIDSIGYIHDAGRLERINCDVVGYGAGVADRLEELGWPVQKVNGARKVTAFDHRYQNLRAQMWWHLREVFKNRGIGGPIDSIAEQQLANIRYKITTDDKIAIEDKTQFKKRLKYSPDRAEAILYCYMDADLSLASGMLPGFGEYGLLPPPRVPVAARFVNDDGSDDYAVEAWLEQDAILNQETFAPPRVRGLSVGLRGRHR